MRAQYFYIYLIMSFLPSIIFGIILISSISLFIINCNKIYRNIALGKNIDRFDNKKDGLDNDGDGIIDEGTENFTVNSSGLNINLGYRF